MKNYYTVSNEIFTYNLSPTCFYVYSYLCRCKDKHTGQCYPSKKTIAEKCGISKSSVSRAVKFLVACGLVKITPSHRQGRQINNNYTVTELSTKICTAVSHTDGGGVTENPPPMSQGTRGGVTMTQEINKQESYNKNNINNHSFNKQSEMNGLNELLKKLGLENFSDRHARETLESIISQMYVADYITVSGTKIPQEMVRKQIVRLDEETLSFAHKKMCESSAEISRGSNYMMACIYNAANEYDLHISREVAQWV